MLAYANNLDANGALVILMCHSVCCV